MFGLVDVKIGGAVKYIVGAVIVIVLIFGIRGCWQNLPSEKDKPVDFKEERDSLSARLDTVLFNMGELVDDLRASRDSAGLLLNENSRLLSELNSLKYKKSINDIKGSDPVGDSVVDSLRNVYYGIDSTSHTIRKTKGG